MNFLDPWIFWTGIPLACIMVFVWITSGIKKHKLLCRWFGSQDEAGKHMFFSPRMRWWKRLLMFAGFLLLAVTAAGPWWGYHRTATAATGRDIAVLFDVSKSMLAEDTAPSRMDHARWLVRQIAEAHPGDRLALVPFAGRAVMICPLTSDQHTFRMLLDSLDCSIIPHGGTNIALALQTAARALQEAAGDEKAILLITDGEELSGDAAAEAALLQQNGISLLIVGIGSDTVGAPIPETLPNGSKSFKRDAAGNIITTKMASALLHDLAKTAGGEYFHSQAADDRLGAINNAISSVKRNSAGDEFKTIPIARFMPFLAIGTLLLLAGVILPERPALRKSLLLLLTFTAISPLLYGAADSEQEETLSSLELFNKGAEVHSFDPEAAENFYKQALTSSELVPEVTANILLNTGELRHNQARNHETAAENAVASNPDEAIKTLEEALTALAAAGEAYTASLAEAVPSDAVIQNNIMAWNDDRERIEKRKKELEDLLQQQQQTQQQTQQAAEQNQQGENSQQARQQTADAGKSAKDLAEAAQNAGAEDLAQRAENAAGKLQEAQAAQERGDDQDAAAKIAEALQELAGKQGTENGEKETAGDKKQQQAADQETPTAADPSEQAAEEARAYGDALLREMAEREQEQREALRKMNSGRLPVTEKDW